MTVLLSTASIHHLVAAHAEANPDRVAVKCGTEVLTYSRLEEQAKGLASRLTSLGAGPDILVAILVDRSLTLMTSILGVLKAGSGYLPVDVETPAERIRFMIEDSAPAILITQRTFQGLVGELGDKIRILYLDDLSSAAEEEPDSIPTDTDPNSLAYVIYTSGSTGRPKGVEITHDALNRFCAHMQQELTFTAGDTMLAIASASFDVAIFELLFPLYCGGRVVILPRSAAADGKELADAIASNDASVLLATPATWKILIDAGWKGDPSLRAVSGGEVMQPSFARLLRSRTKELWNHYGPTEATIATTTYSVRGDEEAIPIGRAIAGVQLFVLDAEGQPARRGEAGELYISGPRLARGYRRDPVRTAERFIRLSNALGGIRAYRTGDLVRVTQEGELEFSGRVDNQVKIRGHRVELEEIEAAFTRHPTISEAAVVTQDHGVDDRRLVAFVVGTDGIKHDAGELRRFLGAVLYSFMVPGKIFFLPALPKNTNGKIDRRALQVLAQRESATGALSPVTAGNRTEIELLKIWRKIPGFESIGITDSFFDYGGHSLLAGKLMNEVGERFGLRLPLATLFEAPTVEALARVIEAGPQSRPWSPLVPVRTTGSRAPLFCVHGIGGNVLNFERLGIWLDPAQPLYCLQAFGVDHGAPLASVEEMATAYLHAVRTVQPFGPYLLSGYSAGGIVAFEMARQLREAGEQVALLILFDALMYASARTGNRTSRIGGTLQKVKKLGARVALFFRMRGPERWASLGRNWTYYWWLLGITVRTRSYLLLKRIGIPLGPPAKMQDAFALAIHQYQLRKFDGPALLYRAAHGDSGGDMESTMGWEDVVSHLIVEECEADHLGMFYEPHVKALANSLDRRLRAALEPFNS